MSNTTTCSVPDCDRAIRVKAAALCSPHYQRKMRGSADMSKPIKRSVHERDEHGRKRCSKCQGWKPEAAFSSSFGKGDGLQSRCKECLAAYYRANAGSVRDKMREARFGITRDQFDAVFKAQGSACATCGTDDPGTSYWCVDHDHACCPGSDKTCGKCIRGILCRACNHALGNVRDNPATLRNLIDYLAEGPIDLGAIA